MAGPEGIEPSLTVLETGVLPLYDGPIGCGYATLSLVEGFYTSAASDERKLYNTSPHRHMDTHGFFSEERQNAAEERRSSLWRASVSPTKVYFIAARPSFAADIHIRHK